MTLLDAARQALEALACCRDMVAHLDNLEFIDQKITALRQAIEQAEQRKPLSDEEIDRVTDQQWASNNHKPIYAAHRAYARAIERAHGIGN